MHKLTDFNRYGVVAGGKLITYSTLTREWRCGQCGRPLVQKVIEGKWRPYCHTCQAVPTHVMYYTDVHELEEQKEGWHDALVAAGLAKGVAGEKSRPPESPGWREALRGAGLLEKKEDADANTRAN